MTSQISVQNRRIVAQINNGWRDLQDTEILVNLDKPDKDGFCKGTSSLEFTKYMSHNLIALNFRVDYQANLPTKP